MHSNIPTLVAKASLFAALVALPVMFGEDRPGEKQSVEESVKTRRWGSSVLFCAGSRDKKDLAELEKLLTAHPELANYRFRLRYSNSALLTAADKNSAAAIKILLAHGADPQLTDASLQTPVQRAATFECTEALEAFAEAGVDLNYIPPARAIDEARSFVPTGMSITPDHLSALDVAAKNGCEKAVDVLLKHGAKLDANPPETSFSALHCAFLALHIRDIDPSETDPRSLELVGAKDNSEVIDLLISHGADLQGRNSAGNQPIHVAIESRAIEPLRYLLSHYREKTDLEAKGRSQMTPLAMAVLRWRINPHHPRDGVDETTVIRMLLEAGADKTAVSGEQKMTAYAYALREQDWATGIGLKFPQAVVDIVKP